MDYSMDLLRFVIAGSVDDGKSTLIGRLLYDSGQIFDDQIEAVKKADLLDGEMDFSLFTDGLSVEREQKITVDVAYRYFSTPSRRFIVADVPGHEQYTRNMATGASRTDAALLLIDARKGLLPQTQRHLSIVALLRIPHVAIVVNKMDSVGYDPQVFEMIKRECEEYAGTLGLSGLTFIPVSSLKGDMLVNRGENLPWYQGPTVMEYLEGLEVGADKHLHDFRFPVQYVVRPNQDVRGYAGTVEGGVVKVGDSIQVFPSGHTSRVKEIVLGEEKKESAVSGEAVVLMLHDERDIARGDMIVHEGKAPTVSHFFTATLVWLSDTPLLPGNRYLLKHTTNSTNAFVDRIVSAETLAINESADVVLKTQKPLIFDSYEVNKSVGCFILIDERTGMTAGAGVIKRSTAPGVFGEGRAVAQEQGTIVWFTGLSGAGKTTIATRLAEVMREKGVRVEHLDGDTFRKELNIGLGFTEYDRHKNIEIAWYVAQKLASHGVFVVASFISPHREQRERFRAVHKPFLEVYVNTPIEVCALRDTKGLYKKASAGTLGDFTGISQGYEPPTSPDLELNTEIQIVDECVSKISDIL